MAGSSNDFSRGGDISRGDFFSWLKISVVAIWKYRVKGSLNLRSENFSGLCSVFSGILERWIISRVFLARDMGT
jgi:hypothetical protein